MSLLRTIQKNKDDSRVGTLVLTVGIPRTREPILDVEDGREDVAVIVTSGLASSP
jgi:hypothetical protein